VVNLIQAHGAFVEDGELVNVQLTSRVKTSVAACLVLLIPRLVFAWVEFGDLLSLVAERLCLIAKREGVTGSLSRFLGFGGGRAGSLSRFLSFGGGGAGSLSRFLSFGGGGAGGLSRGGGGRLHPGGDVAYVA